MVIGIIILCFGIICLINQMDIGMEIEFTIVWPIIVLVLALNSMVKKRRLTILGLLFSFIGIWYILYYFNILTFALGDFIFPIIIIAIGLSIIFEKKMWDKQKEKTSIHKVNKEGILTFNGIFGGVSESIKNADFKGCNINAIFGSVDLDLRELNIKDNVNIEANSIFGGIDIKASDNYNIVISSFAMFGGNDNKHNKEYDENKKTIYINCVSIFGGTDIK